MKKILIALIIILIAIGLDACSASSQKGDQLSTPEVSLSPTANVTVTSSTTLTPTDTPKDADFLMKVDERKTAIMQSKTDVEITGSAFYVSNSGDDTNDGLSPETAWATIDQVNQAPLKPGDAVLFERGGIWRGKVLFCQPGVTYSAYGDGQKPTITLSPEDGVGAEKWTLFYEGTSGEKIWQFYRDMEDLGNLFFDEGMEWGYKVAPKWMNGQYVDENKQPFDVTTGLKTNLAFFSQADSHLPATGSVNLWEQNNPGNWGPLYLRSDDGNPGEIFQSIEFGSVGYSVSEGSVSIVRLADDSVVDNLRIVFGGNCGAGGAAHNAVIQNCEIGWVGGGVLTYNDNYLFSPEDGSVNVAGDGIGLGGIGATIQNNYIHDSFYDGITIEDASMQQISDVQIKGNLFEKNHVGIQMVYYNNDENAPIFFKNIEIADNYVVSSGYGWSTDQATMRHNNGGQWATSLGFGDFSNPSEEINIHDNTFYDALDVQLYGKLPQKYIPAFTNNTFYSRSNESDFSLWSDDMYWTKAGQANQFLLDIFGNDSNQVIAIK